MVKIPDRIDPTLEAMKEASFKEQFKEGKRNYLGASSVGRECARQIWYDFNGYPKEPLDVISLWNFEDGHRTEDLTAYRLRQVHNITLWTHKENGEQYGFSAFDGKFKGHFDGVIVGLLQAPKTPHVWECKASGQKKFDEFKKIKFEHGEKKALKVWNNNYYVQAQIYMHYLKLDRHYTTVALAGGRDYESCRTEYAPEIAEKYIDRAYKIINAKEPPPKINEKPDFYLCRFCEFKDICHNENTSALSRSCFKEPI